MTRLKSPSTSLPSCGRAGLAQRALDQYLHHVCARRLARTMVAAQRSPGGLPTLAVQQVAPCARLHEQLTAARIYRRQRRGSLYLVAAPLRRETTKVTT